MTTDFTRRNFLVKTGAAAVVAAALPAWAQTNKTVTVAFVGVAHLHTPGYLNEVAKHANVKVKYVWDHDAARASRRAAEVGATAVTELKTIWADAEVAGVIILSETNRHAELVLAAAAAGKHLFVEKPLGITAAESRQMAAAIQAKKLLFTTGYFQRIDPKHLFLKGEIAKGNFGKITRVRGSNCHNGALAGWFDTEWRWMTDPQLAGVGAFGDLGTHKLDILMWLFGGIAAVTGDIQSVTGRYGSCDETGEALLRFESGLIGTLAAGWVDVEDPVKLLISGTAGHALILNEQLFYQSDKREDTDNRKPWKMFPPAPPPPLAQFLHSLAGATNEPLVTAAEAADRVVVMQAIYEAARTQQWVRVS